MEVSGIFHPTRNPGEGLGVLQTLQALVSELEEGCRESRLRLLKRFARHTTSLVKKPKELLQYLQKQQTHRFQWHSATFSANTVSSPLKVGLKESVMFLGFGSPLNTP